MSATRFDDITATIDPQTDRYHRYLMDLAVSIQEELKRKGMKQRDLARQLGMKDSQLSRILSGTGNPTLQTIARLASALGTELLAFPVFDEWSDGRSKRASKKRTGK